MQEFQIIAKTMQGLEPVLAQELTELGANNIEAGRRMVSFTGDKEMLYRANFALRTALKILKPIHSFRATNADEVYDAVKAFDWERHLTLDTTFAVDSVVYSNEFRHSKFVAYKVKDAIADHFMEKYGKRPNIRVTNPDLQLHIHVSENDCTLSLDSSGESLHQRGYRQETVPAPLNEVLAAGIILTTGWRGERDFIDPMCGSGTLLIEAALIAKNIAPGVYRKSFAFEKWKDFDKEMFEAIYNDDSAEREFTHKIYGWDNDRDAVLCSMKNVRAAGLSGDISIGYKDIQDFVQPAEPSLMVVNPPYGERITSPDLPQLYKTLGERLKHQFVGGEAWVLSCHDELFANIGLKPSLRLPFLNGSLECELRKYQIFDGRYNDFRADGLDIRSESDRRAASERRSFGGNRGQRPRYDDERRGGRHAAGRQGGEGHTQRGYADRQRRQEERRRYFGGGQDFNEREQYDNGNED